MCDSGSENIFLVIPNGPATGLFVKQDNLQLTAMLLVLLDIKELLELRDRGKRILYLFHVAGCRLV